MKKLILTAIFGLIVVSSFSQPFNDVVDILNPSVSYPGLNLYSHGSNNTGNGFSPFIQFKTSNGTYSSPTSVNTYDVLGSLIWSGNSGGGQNDYFQAARIQVTATSNFTSNKFSVMDFHVGNTSTVLNPRMRIDGQTGNIGIKALNPQNPLHIIGNNIQGGGIEDILRIANPVYSVNQNDGVGLLLSARPDDYGARISLIATNSNPGFLNPRLDFGVQNSNTNNYNDISTKMSILGNGNVGIGTLNPDSRLTVKGKIHCEEVLVDLSIPPDYVFQKYYKGYSDLNPEYKMPTLGEVEAFTELNNHLPNVPSAKDIQENGLQLKEMTSILLQKIEELTLYAIEQEKRIKALETELGKKQ